MALRNMLMPKNQMAVIEDTTEGRTYHCVDCGAQFNDKNKMEVHFISHNKVYRFLCGICGTGLKRKEHLDRHTLGHQEVRPHACPECGKCFKRKEHLNIHRAIHIGEKAHACNLCDRSFYRKDHLQKHIQTHSKSFNVHEDFMPDQEFVDIKEEEFMDVKQEMLDYDEEDLSSEQNFIASMEVGGEEVEPMGSSQSTGAGIPTKDRPHACDLCEKTYKRKDHLKMHSYTHTKKNKICTECGKAFHREEQLLNHMSTHLRSGLGDGLRDSGGEPYVEHNIGIMPIEDLLVPRPDYSDERPHACDICGRRFKRKQHLKVHASVHMRLRAPASASANCSVWCSNCGDGFEDNGQFVRHSCEAAGAAAGDAKKENEPEYRPEYQAVYAQDYQTDYPPEFIDVSEAAPVGATPSRAGATLAALAAERSLPTPQKVFVCKFCSKPFKRKDHYKIHLNIHTGVRSFFCPDCGKGFYRKDHLQKHYIVHMKANSVKADGSPYLQRKAVPGLVPIKRPVKAPVKAEVKPEITITAPSAAKLRIPLQIKVPYQVVVAGAADQRPVTVHPQD